MKRTHRPKLTLKAAKALAIAEVGTADSLSAITRDVLKAIE